VDTLGSAYAAVAPTRILDTRNCTGAAKGAVSDNGTVKLLVALGNTNLALGYWAQPIDAIDMNVTVAGTKSNGYLSLYSYARPPSRVPPTSTGAPAKPRRMPPTSVPVTRTGGSRSITAEAPIPT